MRRKGARYVTVEDYGNELNVAELKSLLKERNLKIGETKAELVQRLQVSDVYGNEATRAASKSCARKPHAKITEKRKKAPKVWLTMHDYSRDDISTLQEKARARGLSDVGQKRSIGHRLLQADLEEMEHSRSFKERHPELSGASSKKENVPPAPGAPANNFHGYDAAPILPPLHSSNQNASLGMGKQSSPPAVPPHNVGSQPASAGFPVNVNYNANSTQPMGDPLPTYVGWSQPQLKEELKSRDMRVSGSTTQLMKRLEHSDRESSLFHKQAMESAARARRERNVRMRGPNWKKPDSLASIKLHDKKIDECVRHGPEGKPVYDNMEYELGYEKCSKRLKIFPGRGQRNFEEEAHWAKELEKSRKMYEIMGVLDEDNVSALNMEWRVAKDLQIPYHKVELCDFEEWKRRGFSIANRGELENLPEELLDMTAGSAYRK